MHSVNLRTTSESLFRRRACNCWIILMSPGRSLNHAERGISRSAGSTERQRYLSAAWTFKGSLDDNGDLPWGSHRGHKEIRLARAPRDGRFARAEISRPEHNRADPGNRSLFFPFLYSSLCEAIAIIHFASNRTERYCSRTTWWREEYDISPFFLRDRAFFTFLRGIPRNHRHKSPLCGSRRNLLMQIRQRYNARSRMMLIDGDRRREICQFFVDTPSLSFGILSDYPR